MRTHLRYFYDRLLSCIIRLIVREKVYKELIASMRLLAQIVEPRPRLDRPVERL
jgi:hypothetical protein